MAPDERARLLFEATFGHAPSHLATAPGRVNLIGEHTDYNGGLVLPLAIPRHTAVALAVNDADRFQAVSEQMQGAGSTAFDGPIAPQITFHDYLRGARLALAERGFRLSGAEIAVCSDVPIGSGLSSSAALLVATLRALRAGFDLADSDFELARIAHRAEHAFVGVPVGVMDPMACSLARSESALLLNTQTLEYQQVAFPAHLELAVIDSGQHHEHSSGAYRTRRAECDEAAAALGVKLLCELDQVPNLPELFQKAGLSPRLRARVSHVLSENQRVGEAVHALRRGDGEGLGRLLAASHASLRDQFEVSTPEIDVLVETASAVTGCLGARMTGGGFGGSIVVLAAKGEGLRVANATIENAALRVPRLRPRVVVPLTPSGSVA